MVFITHKAEHTEMAAAFQKKCREVFHIPSIAPSLAWQSSGLHQHLVDTHSQQTDAVQKSCPTFACVEKQESDVNHSQQI